MESSYIMTYRDRVYKLLVRDMVVGSAFIIDDKVSPDNRQNFVDIVKEYIRFYNGTDPFVIEFSDDYKHLIKRRR
jgi:hypothetical protein